MWLGDSARRLSSTNARPVRSAATAVSGPASKLFSQRFRPPHPRGSGRNNALQVAHFCGFSAPLHVAFGNDGSKIRHMFLQLDFIFAIVTKNLRVRVSVNKQRGSTSTTPKARDVGLGMGGCGPGDSLSNAIDSTPGRRRRRMSCASGRCSPSFSFEQDRGGSSLPRRRECLAPRRGRFVGRRGRK